MNNIEIIAGSVLLGAAAGFLTVQIFVFLGSIIISLIGLIKERTYNSQYLMVWLKSVAGIAACVIFFFLGDYIFRNKLGFTYNILDMFIFWSVLTIVVLAFVLHITRRIKRSFDIVSMPEFDVFHKVETGTEGIDDYVKKNMELVRLLNEERHE